MCSSENFSSLCECKNILLFKFRTTGAEFQNSDTRINVNELNSVKCFLHRILFLVSIEHPPPQKLLDAL
jgi:hypothetical protein